MKQLLSIACLLLLTGAAQAQGKINVALKKELDSLFAADQQYREILMMKDPGARGDSLAQALNVPRSQLNDHLRKLQNHIDSLNLERIEKIIGQYGYPGKTLVGTPTNEAAFYIIQHSPKIRQYIPLIEAAARKGELPFPEYAKMYDRLLMQEGKEQIYGTQVYSFFRPMKNGPPQQSPPFIWPIKDPVNVNSRRKEAGFTDTQEEYTRRFGFEYKVMTMKEMQELKKKYSPEKQ